MERVIQPVRQHSQWAIRLMAVFRSNGAPPKVVNKQLPKFRCRSQIFVFNNCDRIVHYKFTIQAVRVDRQCNDCTPQPSPVHDTRIISTFPSIWSINLPFSESSEVSYNNDNTTKYFPNKCWRQQISFLTIFKKRWKKKNLVWRYESSTK